MTADVLCLAARAWDRMTTEARARFLVRHHLILNVESNPRNIVFNCWRGQYRADQRRIAQAMLKGERE